MLLKLQNKEWFKKNTIQDGNGDYWLSREDKLAWEKDEEPNNWYILKSQVGIALDTSKQYNAKPELFIWAAKYEITKEKYPEYFL